RIALLSFMLGAMDTSKDPVVAPTGIVMLIDVPLQVLTVTAAPFSNTALPPCKAPNPVPEITTWLPMDPVVAETAVMSGAGAAAELSVLLSNVTVTNAVYTLSLPDALPISFCAMLTVWLVPN